MNNLESGNPAGVLAGATPSHEPVAEDERPWAAGSPDAGPASASAGESAETPLVWPPTEEDLDQVEVVEVEWAQAPAPTQAASPSDHAPALPPGLSVSPAEPAGEGQPSFDVRQAPPPAPAPPERTEPLALFGGVSGTAASHPRAMGAVQRRTSWWLIPIVVLANVVGLAIGWYIRPFIPFPSTVNLAIETMPPGATVDVDGVSRGTSPVRMTLPPGEHRLAVTNRGVTREVSMQLKAGTDVVRVFDFATEPPTTGTSGLSGSLDVQTRPAGAQVVVGGQSRGLTPVTLEGLPVGTVEVQLTLNERTVTELVEIRAGKPALLVVPMTIGPTTAPGWISVRSEIPLRIVEGGRVVGTTDSERIMLAGGRHNLELVNGPLEVRLARPVFVQGGRSQVIEVARPVGLVNINARPWAEVFAQGTRLGETPLGNVSLPVGDHELVFRHPQFGERRQTVTVRAATPARVSVTFTP